MLHSENWSWGPDEPYPAYLCACFVSPSQNDVDVVLEFCADSSASGPSYPGGRR